MPFIDLPDRIPGLRAQARSDKQWYQFRNVAADEAELFLYEEIGGWGIYAEDFIAELKQVTAPKLRVRMSSPGGSVFEGIALANALRAHPAEVTVQVDGIAASIASVIAMAADRVVVQPQAMIMVHEASGLCVGNSQDMTDMAALLDKISGNIADAYAAKAGGTRDEWRQVMKGEAWYTAEEAVEAGLADEMVAPKQKPQADDEPEMRSFDLTAYGYAGPKQPAPAAPQPKPAPPAASQVADEAVLTEDIRSLIGAEVAAQLAAAVAPAEETPSAEPAAEAPAAEPVEPVAAEPPAETEPAGDEPAAEPDNAWADIVAHLTDDADDWTAAVAHLTEPTASHGAAAEA